MKTNTPLADALMLRIRDHRARVGRHQDSRPYHYTLIAWNDTQLNLVVDQGSPDKLCNPDGNLPDKSFVTLNNGTTALSSLCVGSKHAPYPPSCWSEAHRGFVSLDSSLHPPPIQHLPQLPLAATVSGATCRALSCQRWVRNCYELLECPP